MNAAEYISHDAVALAGLIARREASPQEVMEAALARLAEVNPKINAVTLDLGEAALAEVAAGAPDGPLGGVPFLLKDLAAQLAGTPTTGGSQILGDKPAVADSALVAKFKAAGLVIAGKTNTPEFGLEPVTEPARFGPTRNPWNLSAPRAGPQAGRRCAAVACRHRPGRPR